MKRYAMFGGQLYYAGGGWNDFLWDSDDAQNLASEIMQRIADFPAENARWVNSLGSGSHDVEKPEEIEWWHIVDLTTGKVVQRSDRPPHGGE